MDRSNHERNPTVVDYRLRGGEALLLHLESGAYHELNRIGAEIWDLVDGRRSAREIADQLQARLEDPPEDLEAIVSGYLADLEERGLLV